MVSLLWRFLMRFFALLFAVLAWSSQAEADYHSAFDFSEIASVHVQLVDIATGACWTNLKEVREYVEEKFRMKGVKIVDKLPSLSDRTFTFQLTVNSQRLYKDGSGPCYRSVETELYTSTILDRIYIIKIFDTASIGADPKNLNRTTIKEVASFFSTH